ncbi:hypothetical protein K8I31_20825 [bacterium]|nr:hypothetical protein [bacterium]
MKQKVFTLLIIAALLAASYWAADYYFGPPNDLIVMPYQIMYTIKSPDNSVEILHIKIEDNGIVNAQIKNAGKKRQVICFLARIEQYDHMNVFQEDSTEYYDPGEEKNIELNLKTRGGGVYAIKLDPGIYSVTLSAAQYDQNGKLISTGNFWSERIHLRSKE